MKIQVLMENTAEGALCREHGLSLFLEVEGRKLLFDTGKSGRFLENADRMGVDVSAADLVVLSHGHYDHGGGLPEFLNRNQTAKVYVQETAFGSYYASRSDGTYEYIGILPELGESSRLVRLSGDFEIEKGLRLFRSMTGERFTSGSNQVLLIKAGSGYRRDFFEHEQNLLIEKEGKKVLVSGCAHRGIVNILDRAMELAGGPMDVVIGGFHLSNPGEGGTEPTETVNGIADYLRSFPTRYYTCHCTGLPAFQMLKDRMGAQISYASAGNLLEI